MTDPPRPEPKKKSARDSARLFFGTTAQQAQGMRRTERLAASESQLGDDFRALPNQVLDDVLKMGSQDAFTVAILTWLLDAEGEHGLGRRMVERLGSFFTRNEHSELGTAITSGVLTVKGEAIQREGMVDLAVSVAETPKAALIAKRNVTLDATVLEEYRAMELTPVGFRIPGDPPSKQGVFPVWDWIADLSIMVDDAPMNPYGDFLRQIMAWVERGGAAPHAPERPAPQPDPRSSLPPVPKPAPPKPAPKPTPPPAAPGGGWSGGWGGDGGGLSDGWAGGGGLSDGWMGSGDDGSG